MATKPQRTVQFSCEPEMRSIKEVVSFLQEKGIELEDLIGVCPDVRPGIEVTVKTAGKYQVLVSALKGDEKVNIVKMSDSSVLVTAVSVPLEMPAKVIVSALERYGKVQSIKRCTFRDYPTLFNGSYQFRMELTKKPPSGLCFGSRTVLLRYPGQVRTCLRCGEEGHEARQCQVKQCFRCLSKDHLVKDCKNSIKCTVCNEEGHDYSNCPKAVLNTRSEVGKSWTDVVQGKAGSEPTEPEHNESVSESSPLVIAETSTNSEETTPSKLDSQPASPAGSEDLFSPETDSRVVDETQKDTQEHVRGELAHSTQQMFPAQNKKSLKKKQSEVSKLSSILKSSPRTGLNLRNKPAKSTKSS